MQDDVDMNAERTSRANPRERFGGIDFAVGGELLKAAAHYVIPEDMSKRQAFAHYMPDLYVLRNKGCSFPQLAELLKQVGLKLQPSTVRVYYTELLADRLDECQRRMNEQIILMAKVCKEVPSIDNSTVSARVAKLSERNRALADEKADGMFGVPAPKNLAPPPSATAARDSAQPVPAKTPWKQLNNPIVEDEPVVPSLTLATSEQLQNAIAAPSTTNSATNSTAPAQSKNSETTRKLRCNPINSGVKPIKRRKSYPKRFISQETWNILLYLGSF